jgi:hypothetical protein
MRIRHPGTNGASLFLYARGAENKDGLLRFVNENLQGLRVPSFRRGTPEQHQLGGYETWLGTNFVQEDTSVILTGQLLEMLADLRKDH